MGYLRERLNITRPYAHNRSRLNSLTTKDTKVHEGSSPGGFPSCSFVSFVVNDLPQRRKQRFFPALIVHGPADFGFAFLFEDGRPDRLIPVIGGHVQAIDHGHASRQLALSFDVDVVLAPMRSDRRIERNRHRLWIGQRNTVFASLHFVSFARVAVALDGKLREWVVESENAHDVVLANHGFSAGKMPA